MEWISTKDRLPADMQPCLFVAGEFGYQAMAFFGFRFKELWFVSRQFYGLDGPDRIAPADVYCWTPWNKPPKEMVQSRFLDALQDTY